MLFRTGIRDNPSRGDGAVAKSPEKPFIPELLLVLLLDPGECPCNALVGVVHGRIQNGSCLGFEPVFLVPDIQGGFLLGNRCGAGRGGVRMKVHFGVHWKTVAGVARRKSVATPYHKILWLSGTWTTTACVSQSLTDFQCVRPCIRFLEPSGELQIG